MGANRWDEEGKIWEEDHTLLKKSQLDKCARAYEADSLPSPVPTRMVSNGEYMPAPQTNQQKSVEARIQELSRFASKKLGMDRRRFLRSTGGMAASFLAMNEVYGRFFNVNPIEMFEPEAYATSLCLTISCTWFAATFRARVDPQEKEIPEVHCGR